MLQFQTFVHEINGMITISNGDAELAFETPEEFSRLVPGYSLPSGRTGVNYEIRGNLTLFVYRDEDGNTIKPDAEDDGAVYDGYIKNLI